MKRYFRLYLSRLILILYIISVFLLCFLNLGAETGIATEWFGIPTDKIAHFLMFFPYPALITFVFCKSGWNPMKFIGFLLVVLVTGIIIGGSIELLQGLTGYRGCDIKDFRADCLGLFTGALLTLSVWLAVRRKESRHMNSSGSLK